MTIFPSTFGRLNLTTTTTTMSSSFFVQEENDDDSSSIISSFSSNNNKSLLDPTTAFLLAAEYDQDIYLHDIQLAFSASGDDNDKNGDSSSWCTAVSDETEGIYKLQQELANISPMMEEEEYILPSSSSSSKPSKSALVTLPIAINNNDNDTVTTATASSSGVVSSRESSSISSSTLSSFQDSPFYFYMDKNATNTDYQTDYDDKDDNGQYDDDDDDDDDDFSWEYLNELDQGYYDVIWEAIQIILVDKGTNWHCTYTIHSDFFVDDGNIQRPYNRKANMKNYKPYRPPTRGQRLGKFLWKTMKKLSSKSSK